MRLVLWSSVLALAACRSGDDDKTGPDTEGDTDTDTDTDADTDTDTDADTDTDTDTEPEHTGTLPTGFDQPTRLELACTLQADNALRFDCALVVEPAQPVELTFARTDGLGATRTVSSSRVVTDHALPLYFMAPGREYQVTAHATEWPADEVGTTVTTGAVPNAVRSSLTLTGTSTMGMIGSHLPCSDDATAVVYDTTTGDLLWYEEMDPGGEFGEVDMVVFTEDQTVLGESNGDVIEVDLMGTDLVRLDDLDTAFGVTAGGLFGDFHHDIAKHDGVYYVVYQESYGGGFQPDILDTLVLFDATGTELARWYPIDHLTLPADWSGDFLHTNTITVDANGDILLSWLTQDTIAKIDGDWTSATFGEPLWFLAGGARSEVGNTITTDWSAVGGEDSFDEPHSLSIRADGLLQLLDNQHGRSLVLDLDEVNDTAVVVGEYDTRERSCGPQGTARSTRSGNPVVGCMGDWVREYDFATGSSVWEAEVQCPGGGGGGGGFGFAGAARWYPLDGW